MCKDALNTRQINQSFVTKSCESRPQPYFRALGHGPAHGRRLGAFGKLNFLRFLGVYDTVLVFSPPLGSKKLVPCRGVETDFGAGIWGRVMKSVCHVWEQPNSTEAGHGRPRPGGWPRLAVADHVQPWPTVAGHGRPWAAIAACCLRLAMAKQRRLGPPMLAMASRCCLLWPAIAGQLDAVWEPRAAW